MSILSFFRRTKSRYADDKSVDDFTRVVEQTGLLTEQQRISVQAEPPGRTASDEDFRNRPADLRVSGRAVIA